MSYARKKEKCLGEENVLAEDKTMCKEENEWIFVMKFRRSLFYF